MLVRGKWYLACVCDVPDLELIGIGDVLGVDLGMVNIAFDSDGRAYTGETVEAPGQKFNRRRAGLQQRGFRGAKRSSQEAFGNGGPLSQAQEPSHFQGDCCEPPRGDATAGASARYGAKTAPACARE